MPPSAHTRHLAGPAASRGGRLLSAALVGIAAGLRAQRGRAGSGVSRAATGAVERLPAELLGLGSRHPLSPAALRVERTRSHGAEPAEQVAVTVWFGEGPALPAITGSKPGPGRAALRIGASLLGAAALAAATTAAARLAEAERPRIVDAHP